MRWRDDMGLLQGNRSYTLVIAEKSTRVLHFDWFRLALEIASGFACFLAIPLDSCEFVLLLVYTLTLFLVVCFRRYFFWSGCTCFFFFNFFSLMLSVFFGCLFYWIRCLCGFFSWRACIYILCCSCCCLHFSRFIMGVRKLVLGQLCDVV